MTASTPAAIWDVCAADGYASASFVEKSRRTRSAAVSKGTACSFICAKNLSAKEKDVAPPHAKTSTRTAADGNACRSQRSRYRGHAQGPRCSSIPHSGAASAGHVGSTDRAQQHPPAYWPCVTDPPSTTTRVRVVEEELCCVRVSCACMWHSDVVVFHRATLRSASTTVSARTGHWATEAVCVAHSCKMRWRRSLATHRRRGVRVNEVVPVVVVLLLLLPSPRRGSASHRGVTRSMRGWMTRGTGVGAFGREVRRTRRSTGGVAVARGRPCPPSTSAVGAGPRGGSSLVGLG